MKKYMFSVKMASKNGAQAHLVVAAHEAEDMVALTEMLNAKDFIVVQQFVRNYDGTLVDVGPTILNQRVIGKVREWKDKPLAQEEF